MNDDAGALRAAWMSDAAADEDDLRLVVDRVLDKDEAARAHERRLRIGGAAALAAFVPVLIWAAAYGITPLVRVAYALMAIGCVASVVAEWLYLGWSRRALPGPDDTRSQLQRTAFMLDCQAWLARTAALWSAPIFIGVLLICAWLYRERTVTGAMAIGVIGITAWSAMAFFARRGAADLTRRKRHLEQVLTGLYDDRR